MKKMFLLAVLLAAAGCARQHPSVVLISMESMRADELFGKVGGKEVAPNLAALAGQSLVFERAMSGSSWTSPSMMGVMTGLYPPAHGLEEHDRALAAEVPTLAEYFSRAGFQTGAVLPALTLRPEYGFSRGFTAVEYHPFGHDVITSPFLTGKTLHLLDQFKGRPFFLWVHFWDPHYNYTPPAPWDQMFRQGERPEREDVQCLKWIENPLKSSEAAYLRGQYRGEVHYTDGYVKQILDHLAELGLEQNTIVAVVGDHGEAFQEHGWLGHTVRLDQEMIHVPLTIRFNKGLAPRKVAQFVSTASLGRTLLELAGVEDASTFGRLPALPLSLPAGPAPPLLSQTVRMGCYTSLIEAPWKYTLDQRTCGETLFDLAGDPGETRDLAGSRPAEVRRLRTLLRAQLRDIDAAGIPKGALPKDLVEEAEAALRAIGYLAGGPAGAGGGEITCTAVPDPRNLPRDAFGDVQVFQPCPREAARGCLAKLP